ncbi:MAG: hypothetical protein PHW73_00290 [Atribacterota bacterium]|nr:hypothetical protein [Atribacterota bacterium]
MIIELDQKELESAFQEFNQLEGAISAMTMLDVIDKDQAFPVFKKILNLINEEAKKILY